MTRVLAAALMVCALPAPAFGQQPDSVQVAGTVAAFRDALATGDSAGAIRLLAPDARILESGGVETVEQYRSHHLAADIEFLRAVPQSRGAIAISVVGDVAWATSTSSAKGQFRGREVNSASAELMVLQRSGDGWLIRAIHWSSRARR